MLFRDRTYSVLTVSGGEKFHRATKALLPPSDYWPVDCAMSAAQARRMLSEKEYDLLLINTPLPDDFGTALASDVCAESSTGVLLFVKSDVFDDVYAEVVEFGAMAIALPTSSQMVLQTVRGLCAARERLLRVQEKQATVEDKINEIRIVNRAKWLLIECLSMTEEDAHRYIDKMAMDQRITRRQAAEDIIKTYK